MEVIINNKEYKVRDLTLEEYEFAKNIEELKSPQVISLFTGAPIDEIKKAPFNEVKMVAELLQKSYQYQSQNEKLEEVITIGDRTYGLIIPSKISFEEWINLEVFMVQDKMDLPLVAAHLYKPLVEMKGTERILEPYSLEECQLRAQGDFKRFPISVFFPALFFFSTFAVNYTELILSSLETKMTDNNKLPQNENLEKQ